MGVIGIDALTHFYPVKLGVRSVRFLLYATMRIKISHIDNLVNQDSQNTDNNVII